jgi:ABC-type transport system involved in cytochrome bd biosynthesis fused ATPase/permease subunit
VAVASGEDRSLALKSDGSVWAWGDNASGQLETGREVIDGLVAATRDETVVLITHDLAAAARTDEIVVVEAGRTVERGTHEALLALQGRYARMWGLAADPDSDGA